MNTTISNQPITSYPITDSNPMEGLALLRAVGNTPLLPLRRVTEGISPNVQVYAKAEWFNPGGSVKDRPAFNIIRSAVNECGLLPGMRLLDSTSGNMGIAYATFGAALDIPITLGADAHHPDHVCGEFDLALERARDAGYKEIRTIADERWQSIEI